MAPQYQQPYAQPAKPKKTLKIVLIVLAVAAVYGVLQIVNSIVNKDEPPVEYKPNQITDTTQGATPGSTWDVPAQTGGTTNNGTTPATTGNPSNSTGNTTSNSTPANNAAAYSTDALPQESDFDWFYDNMDNYTMGLRPAAAENFTDPDLLGGGWMVTIYRTDPAGDITEKEFQHFDMTVKDGQIEADVKWSGRIESDGVWQDSTNVSPDHYSGTASRSGDHMGMEIKDYYDIVISISDFYFLNGKQYGIGTYYTPWDQVKTIGYVAFCRP